LFIIVFLTLKQNKKTGKEGLLFRNGRHFFLKEFFKNRKIIRPLKFHLF